MDPSKPHLETFAQEHGCTKRETWWLLRFPKFLRHAIEQSGASLGKSHRRCSCERHDAALIHQLFGKEGHRSSPLCPSRGEAYLANHNGGAAIAEYQKFLDHRSIVMNFPLGALAHLELGRAYALAGESAKARNAYKDFLALWKDADPGIPILKQAKAEYANLQ
jgi:tetratricopeptide (TPR) repeat protein